MALELETQIMMEIGFGNHYSWYNGSASCRQIQIGAANSLPAKIQIHHDRGEGIAVPNFKLINTLERIAAEGDDYNLTRTWEAASYIIVEHVHQANSDEKEKTLAFTALDDYLKENYISKDTEDEIFRYDNYGNIILYTLKSKR